MTLTTHQFFGSKLVISIRQLESSEYSAEELGEAVEIPMQRKVGSAHGHQQEVAAVDGDLALRGERERGADHALGHALQTQRIAQLPSARADILGGVARVGTPHQLHPQRMYAHASKQSARLEVAQRKQMYRRQSHGEDGSLIDPNRSELEVIDGLFEQRRCPSLAGWIHHY